MSSAQAKFLERLTDVLVDDILATSEEELRQEMMEDHRNWDEEVQGMRRLIMKAVSKATENHEVDGEEIEEETEEC
jgi:hypothetical protein